MRAALAVLVGLVAACAPGDPAPAGGVPADGAASLLDVEWRLAAVDGAAPETLPGGDAAVTVTLTDRSFGDLEPDMHSLGGYDGCNAFGVGYRLAPGPEGRYDFLPGPIESDAMSCGGPGAHVSDAVRAGLQAARELRVEAGRLTFSDSLGAERLAFVPRLVRAVDAAAVTTGRWALDPPASRLETAYGLAPARYEVTFGPDSVYTGFAGGCVAFSGRYALDGDRLSVSSFRRDDSACEVTSTWTGPYGLDSGEVEADSARLVIHLRRGGRAVFTRAEVPPPLPVPLPR